MQNVGRDENGRKGGALVFAEGYADSTAVAVHVFTMLNVFDDSGKQEIVLL